MKKNKFITQIIIGIVLTLAFIACDKDFASLDSDVINNENATTFDIKDSIFEIITYTKPLNAVQTNNLNLNQLGIYDDVAYGRTKSSFVTQLSLQSYAPTFKDFIAIDSVTLTIPYFSKIDEVQDDDTIIYEIDSVFGNNPMKLSIFESNYFIRNFNPDSDFSEAQKYFSDKSDGQGNDFANKLNENGELTILTGEGTSYTQSNLDNYGNNVITISNQGFVLTEPDNDDDDDVPQVIQRQSPGIRLKLDPTYWQTKIIDQVEQSVLSSSNNFFEYFRGLYFKAEPVNGNGSFLMLNTSAQNSNITIYYTRLTASTTDEEDATEQETFVLNFGQNKINFIDNTEFTFDLSNVVGDEDDGDSRLYLKGGEGAIAKIKLFNGDKIDDTDDMTFEDWKNFFVETDANGNFLSSKRLINEANLVFHIDQTAVGSTQEPHRIYVYDADNNTPLIDYFIDGSVSSFPEFSIYNHLGPIEREDSEDATSPGVKYKIKMTEHINNLLLRDSTNVELGLSVSLNVNLEESNLQRQVLNNNPELNIPVSSVLSPRGTVLYGNNISDADVDADKKVYLEIYYTEPKN